MTATATIAEDSVLVVEEASARGLSAILQPGQTATVFTGAVNATFRLALTGTIQRSAQIDVTVDGVVATTLTFDFRSTIVNGQSIAVTSKGRDPQGFVATLIS